jgi:hypothetical protein
MPRFRVRQLAVRQIHHPRALQKHPRDGVTRSINILASSVQDDRATAVHDSIPLQAPMRATNAVLAGTCKLYLAGRPMAHPSIAVSAEQSQWLCTSTDTYLSVRRGCFLLDLSHSCSTGDEKPQITVGGSQDEGHVEMRHSFGGFYAKAIYHLASALCACYNNLCRIIWASQTIGSATRCDEVEGR